MNLERLINMVINQVIRRVVNLVVDRGISFASRKAKSMDDNMSPEDREALQNAQDLTKRAGAPRINDQFRG